MAKYAAFGTKILRGAVEIPQVLSISGPSPTMDTIDVTTHDSTDGWEEILPSTLRSGEVTFDVVYDPALTAFKYASGGIPYDMVNRTKSTWTITLPTSPAKSWVFPAYVTGFELQAPVEDKLSVSVTLRVAGAITIP